MKKVTIDLNKIVNFSGSEKNKLNLTIEILERTINSDEFKKRVLEFHYLNNGTIIKHFKNNNGMTNKQVYDLFMSGSDKFNKEADLDIDLYITMYHSFSNTIGYTYPNTYKTWINRKYFKSMSPSSIASNIAHEYCHNLGFGHAVKWNNTREYTVPYAIGNIVNDISEEIENPSDNSPDKPKYKLVCSRPWYFFGLKKVCKYIKI